MLIGKTGSVANEFAPTEMLSTSLEKETPPAAGLAAIQRLALSSSNP